MFRTQGLFRDLESPLVQGQGLLKGPQGLVQRGQVVEAGGGVYPNRVDMLIINISTDVNWIVGRFTDRSSIWLPRGIIAILPSTFH